MAENGKPMPDAAGDGYMLTDDKDQLISDGNSPAQGELQRSEVSPLQLEAHGPDSADKSTEGLRIIIISSISFAVTITVALILTIFLAPPPVQPHGAVACGAQVCSDAGVEILKKGGSAVDSAIATLLCLGVVNPQHSGIGGGGFMVIRDHKKNTSLAIDFRETAPSGVTPATYTAVAQLKEGGGSVGVPGELRGMKAAHEKYGLLSWKELFQPAIKLAKHGFNVTETLAHAIVESINASESSDQALVDLFYRNGAPATEGETLTLPVLAHTLGVIAEEGISEYYEGPVATNITSILGVAVTMGDLKNYHVIQTQPLTASFLNYTVQSMPAPGGGPQLILLLHILESYGKLSPQNLTDNVFYQRLVEAIKFSNAEYFNLGDPNLGGAAIWEKIKNATDEAVSMSYADTLRNLISDNETRTNPAYYLDAVGVATGSGTAQVSVVDTNEIYVSVTSTINNHFGSHIVTSDGIILNNQMADFSLVSATEPYNTNNLPEAGKRPMSSMSPTVVYKSARPCGERMAIGGTNGSRIISGVAQVMLDLLAFNKTLEEALQMPRLYDPLIPELLEYTGAVPGVDTFPQSILDFLSSVGHTNQTANNLGLSYVDVVVKIDEVIDAESDPRQGKGSGAAQY